MTKEHDLEPIREWLDVKEHRRGYFGSTGKEGIGDYYCIPIDVLIKCGMSVDELFFGREKWAECTQTYAPMNPEKARNVNTLHLVLEKCGVGGVDSV